MKGNVIQMSENVSSVRDKLLPVSQELAVQARNFQKNAAELEKVTESRNFWAMSPKCLLIFGGAGGVGVALFFIIRAIIMR